MIGKWNKSVILTYIGLSISIIGIFISCMKYDIKYAFICLILSGVCDLFDGTIARRCKRDESEKEFGIQLDSLVDVVSFIIFPISIFISIGLNSIYHIFVYILYAIFAVARLAYFNISTSKDKPVKHYTGLPVTFAALIFSIFYLLSYAISINLFNIIYSIIILITSFLYVIKIKIKKPSLKISIGLLGVAIILILVYIFI